MNILKNAFYYWAGLLLLILNKFKHAAQGYTNPRGFPISEFRRAVEYDFSVVENWTRYGEKYTGAPFSLSGRTLLELGPGADLGIGLITLLNGAKKYNAMDVNDLVQSVPAAFYEELFTSMEKAGKKAVTVDHLRTQLESARVGRESSLNYVCRKNFDLSVFNGQEIDLVLSNAAFEHFDDVEKTIRQLTPIVKKGALFVVEIDLKTHTRWLREADPLNIYRYPKALYDFFKFRGSPNRLRPCEYEDILRRNGWSDIRVMPQETVEERSFSAVKGSLDKRFRNLRDQMEFVDIMVCATKQ